MRSATSSPAASRSRTHSTCRCRTAPSPRCCPLLPPDLVSPEAESLARGFRLAIRTGIGAGKAIGVGNVEIKEAIFVAYHNALEPGCIDPDDRLCSARLRRLTGHLQAEFAREIDRSGIDRASGFFDVCGPVSRVLGYSMVAVCEEFGGHEAWR